MQTRLIHGIAAAALALLAGACGAETPTFSGIIESHRNTLAVDGPVEVVVSGRLVTIASGWPGTWGRIEWPASCAEKGCVGHRAEVYARSTGRDAFTLEGDEEFYLRVVEQ